jgi:hypothetical protein
MNIQLSEVEKKIIRKHHAGTRSRALIELAIVDALIRAAAEAGFYFEVEDEHEDVTDVEALKHVLFDLDEANIYLRDKNGGRRGWIRLIFGNNGWDLVADYSTNLEAFMTPINEVASFWGA